MNKKLLTAAVGAALAMGATAASADVKLYGKIHVSVDYLDAKANAVPYTGKTTNIVNNTSRWGIDVSEKLGGGLTAIGKLESQIDATGETANTAAASQNRYVGLSGGFGSILAGIHDTPFKELMATTNLFTDQVGDSRNMIRQNGAGGVATGYFLQNSYDWDARPANSIRYQSPAMAGFKVTYLWSADRTTGNDMAPGTTNAAAATAGDDNRLKVSSISLAYSSGPLYAAYAYETHRFNANIGDGGDPTETGSRLAASYSFGSLKVLALYQDLKNLGGKTSTGSSVNRKAWGAGAAYTAGNNVFKAQYYKADKLSNQDDNTAADNTGASMWAIGWDHLFSKTAKAYVAYAKTTNQDNVSLTATAGGHGDNVTPGTGNDPSVWSIGMILDF